MSVPARSPSKQDANAHIVLLLSLELILLAFFILLNGLAEFEQQKQAQVLDSVNKAFRGSVQTPPHASDLPASLGVLSLPQGLTDEIGSRFESFVPSSSASQTDRATVMSVEMPAETLFRPGEDRIRPERKVLIRRLARAMMRDPDGVLKYELAFEHDVPGGSESSEGEPLEGAGAATALAVRRGADMAAYLIRQSIPTDVVSVGVVPGGVVPSGVVPGGVVPSGGETVRFVLRMRSAP